MERILEPEVMDGEEQVRVYANADFAEENQGFVDQFLALYPEVREEIVLDLGCGPADIPIRLLRSRPALRVTGSGCVRSHAALGGRRRSPSRV